jgi:hypothetical protein
VWVRVAADQARQVLHLTSAPEALAAIEAAEGWCDGTVTAEQCRIAATATTANTANAAAAAAANAAAAAVADVGEAAGRAANATVCAIYAAAYVIYAAAYVAHAAYAAERLRLAHRAVDVWCEWAGFTPAAPEPVIVTKAIEQMLQVAQ